MRGLSRLESRATPIGRFGPSRLSAQRCFVADLAASGGDSALILCPTRTMARLSERGALLCDSLRSVWKGAGQRSVAGPLVDEARELELVAQAGKLVGESFDKSVAARGGGVGVHQVALQSIKQSEHLVAAHAVYPMLRCSIYESGI